MPADIRRIEHIVVVLMANRSFDHVLGYLSRPGGRTDVDGIGDDAWRAAHANPGTIAPLTPFALTTDAIPDPPHERDTIALQIGTIGTPNAMQGFVQSYARRQPPPPDESLVMGYYRAPDVPIADFFAALPTGTQPNRLMAMSGATARDVNAPVLLNDQDLVYDWLTARNIPWRVYHHGVLPFFALMPKWQPVILHELAVELLGLPTRFRRYQHFERDVHADPTFPPVVFIEPEYTDGPHHAPDDDHPPTPIARGQAFLRSVYQALTANPERWRRTLLLITYDEHGGFYDHVSPLVLRTDPPTPNAYPPLRDDGRAGARLPRLALRRTWGGRPHPPRSHRHASVSRGAVRPRRHVLAGCRCPAREPQPVGDRPDPDRATDRHPRPASDARRGGADSVARGVPPDSTAGARA